MALLATAERSLFNIGGHVSEAVTTTADVRLLGGARSGTKVLERKAAALLALLTFERTTSRSRASSLLWPNSTAKTARANLRQLLKRLRSNSGALVEGEAALKLCCAVKIDALDAEGLLASDGDLLAGHEYDDCPELSDWLLIQRERVRNSRYGALTARAEAFEREGKLRAALADARRLSDGKPESEDGHRRVMRLNHLLGDRAAALSAFESCRERVRRLCDSEVSDQTRGLAEAIRGGRTVAAPQGLPRREIPLSVERPPVLVGRERAWAQMEAAWAQGTTICVCGEAGVGKTRLANDFVATKGEFVVSHGMPGDRTVPYATHAREFARYRDRWAPHVAPWVRAEMSRILPDLALPGPPSPVVPSRRPKLLEAIAEVVRFTHEGVVGSLFDDLHYIDAESFEAGTYAVQRNHERAPTQRLRHIMTLRASETAPAILEQVRQGAELGVFCLVELEPLSAPTVAKMLASMGVERLVSEASEVFLRTGGNPLFVVELAKSLIEAGETASGVLSSLPTTGRVSIILARRLERVSVEAVQLLRVLAVVKDDFSPELAARMLELPLASVLQLWLELDAARLVRGNWFTHDLLYEQVARTTPREIEQVLHRQAARLLDTAKVSRARILDHQRRGFEGKAKERARSPLEDTGHAPVTPLK